MLFVSSLQSGKAWQACAQQREQSYSHRNSAISRQVYAHTLLVQHLYSVLFQHIGWCGSTTRTAWMQRRQKNWLKYADFTEIKKITSRIYSNYSNYSSLFFKSFKFRCCSIVSLKKVTVGCTNVVLLILFNSWYIIQRKKRSAIFGGFYCVFFKWAFFENNGCFFLLGPITWTLKIITDV